MPSGRQDSLQNSQWDRFGLVSVKKLFGETKDFQRSVISASPLGSYQNGNTQISSCSSIPTFLQEIWMNELYLALPWTLQSCYAIIFSFMHLQLFEQLKKILSSNSGKLILSRYVIIASKINIIIWCILLYARKRSQTALSCRNRDAITVFPGRLKFWIITVWIFLNHFISHKRDFLQEQ
jgi:hypothetical protein